jgi:hypothetical protein
MRERLRLASGDGGCELIAWWLPASAEGKALASERGASLIEALIALAIIVTTITGVAHLLLWSRATIWSSSAGTMSMVLASQKLEQLRALPWQVDPAGHPVSDSTTSLATNQPSLGGSGLAASPAGTLHDNTPGFVDYLDARGVWRGTGSSPPAGAAFVRRWAIVPFDADPLHTLVLHVIVMPLADAVARGGHRSVRAAHLTTIRTRSLP